MISSKLDKKTINFINLFSKGELLRTCGFIFQPWVWFGVVKPSGMDQTADLEAWQSSMPYSKHKNNIYVVLRLWGTHSFFTLSPGIRIIIPYVTLRENHFKCKTVFGGYQICNTLWSTLPKMKKIRHLVLNFDSAPHNG